MRKVLFIEQNCVLDQSGFYPEVIQYLAGISKELDYMFMLFKNEAVAIPVNSIELLKNEHIVFEETIETNELGTFVSLCKKSGAYNVDDAFLISSSENKINGVKVILLSKDQNENACFSTTKWSAIYSYLKQVPRKAKTVRKTSETEIEVEINLDGSGKSIISTGIGFFDHMLDQIARHGNMDLTVHAKGDTHIDEHHTIEDVAIALGETFLKALGAKKGIERYGFLLPMDDCLAQVAVDFGGRPWLVWDVKFERESIGEMPTEMFFHFFKSFSDNAKCNLNINAEGENEHHKIESVFKAFAKALKMAVSKTGDFAIPSTKGVL
jgi:imidazoleglycerol-phosphate dehydratase / histidinol-phosphatase